MKFIPPVRRIDRTSRAGKPYHLYEDGDGHRMTVTDTAFPASPQSSACYLS